MKKLTSTSYAVLALLAVRDHTAYELARQVGRSLNFVWPRAEGRIYDEPKLLVEHGLASATAGATGRRPRTVYAITDDGRARLREWLAEAGDAPQLEYEALLKVAFAEHAGKEALLTNLTAIRDQAAGNLAFGAHLAQQYVDGAIPFPERVPVNGLVWNFLFAVHRSMLEWALWAIDEVGSWPDDLRFDPAMAERTLARFAEMLGTLPPGVTDRATSRGDAPGAPS